MTKRLIVESGRGPPGAWAEGRAGQLPWSTQNHRGVWSPAAVRYGLHTSRRLALCAWSSKLER